jgi:DNA-binding winged helix-turn-helix (wHTH) protein/tetratricopeptide (TPR) repeat protein
MVMEADLPPRLIDLAQTTPFQLGGLEVRPATLEVQAGARREQLEPRIMQVLVALGRRRGEVVSRDELIQTCWGGRVVGDDAINRCIFRLRKLAQDLDGFSIETVPRVGFRLTEGGSRVPRRPPPMALWLGAATVAAVTIAFGAWWVQQFAAPAPGRLRVAIEDTRLTGRDAAMQALAASVTEELVAQVASTGVQAVAGRRGEGADYRLVSTVAPEGGKARITLQLIDPRTEGPVWFAEVTGDPREVRRQAAVAAAGAAQCAMWAREPGAGPIGEVPLRQYVRACGLADDPEAATEALTLLEQVSLHAPRFAPGHSGLALFAAVASKDVDEPLKTTLLEKGRAAAARALQLDPSQGTAVLAQEMLVTPRTNWFERQRLLDRGLAADPESYRLVSRQGLVFAAAGRLSEAEAFQRRAVTLNPLSANAAAELALILSARGSVDDARAVIDRAFQSWPDNPQVQSVRFEIEALHGDPARAIGMLRDPRFGGQIANPYERRILLTAIEARQTGSPQTMARAAELVRASSPRDLWPPLAVQVLGALGDVDGALAIAEQASRTHNQYEPVYLFRGSTKVLRDDPRFMALAQKWGLVDYWRRSGHWPDFCRDPKLPYDCRKAAALVAGV